MARKSGWQQFADNFNGVYGSVTSATRNIQMGRATRADYNDEAGNPLAGDALDRARVNALADIENRYGRPAEGLALRSNQAALQSTNFENDLNVQLRPELLRQRGALQSGLMEAQTNSANASAANSFANANATTTLLPGRVENQGLTNAGLGLSNDLAARTFDYNVDTAQAAARQATADADVAVNTVDSRIQSSQAGADQASTDATRSGLLLEQDQATQDQRIATMMAELTSQNALAVEKTGVVEGNARDQSIFGEVFAEILAQDFGDDYGAANAAIIDALSRTDMTPQGKLAAAELISKFGVQQLASEGAARTQRARDAYRDGGLTALLDLNDNEDNGIDVYPEYDGDTVRAVRKFADGRTEVLATATGPNAEAEVTAQALALYEDPTSSMLVAGAILENQAARAGIGQTEAETDRTVAQTQAIASEVGVNEARIEQIQSSIRVDDAQVVRLVAETAGQLLENDNYQERFAADMENLRSQVAARGTAMQLDEGQIALVAAQVAKIGFDMELNDPSRELTPQERQLFLDREFGKVQLDALIYNPDITEDEIRRMRELFEIGMTPTGITHSQN